MQCTVLESLCTSNLQLLGGRDVPNAAAGGSFTACLLVTAGGFGSSCIKSGIALTDRYANIKIVYGICAQSCAYPAIP
jgi:hypothetical protein